MKRLHRPSRDPAESPPRTGGFMSRLSRTACAALGAAALVTAASAGSALAAPAGSHALPGSVPSWAAAKNRAGSADATQQVTFRVYLNYRGGDAAAAYANAV